MMKIVFESPTMMPSIANALSILTSAARICLDDIQYDAAEGTVEILMRRKELKGFRKFFLLGMQPDYGQTMIDTVLTIRQVVEMNIKVDDLLVTECNSCFTVLIGLKVDGSELYLGSVEEVQGKTLCIVSIMVKGMSIECVDKEKNKTYLVGA